MRTIVSELEEAFRAAIRAAFDIDADPLIGPSTNQTFGDYQSNVAMGLAKRLGERDGRRTGPREVAERIRERLDLTGLAGEVGIAGPGFLNVRLSSEALNDRLRRIAADSRLGVETVPPRVTVIDYSGPNIAKQMHVGHLRSTIIGDSLSRLLEFQGCRVIRQNHIGDWGTQFGMVILGIWHLMMARHRGEPDYISRMYDDLRVAAARKDDSARRTLIQEIHRRHQADLDADPDGERIFLSAVEKLVPRLEELEPAYKLVNAIEDAPESETLTLTRSGARGPHAIRLSRVSNDVIAMLQAGGSANRQEERVWSIVRQATLEEADRIYRRLGVRLKAENVRGESAYRDRLAATVDLLRDSRSANPDDPRIEVRESEGAVVVFHRSAGGDPLFLNKDGEPLPFLIRKSDGAYLYATTDLAALHYRIQTLHADRIVYVTDARQSLHFEMLFATARGAGWTRLEGRAVRLEHVTFGSMTDETGRPLKTRSGENVKLGDLLEEAVARAAQVVREKRPDISQERLGRIAEAVGVGAVKYADLSKDRVSDYVFSWDKMLALDGNTAPYLQYAHARIQSIFRKAGGRPGPEAAAAPESPHERALAMHLARFPEALESAARDLKPHHLCNYLYELAVRFSGFFENCPVIQSAEPLRSARLLLCDITGRTLATGLDLLGIDHPDEM